MERVEIVANAAMSFWRTSNLGFIFGGFCFFFKGWAHCLLRRTLLFLFWNNSFYGVFFLIMDSEVS